ncbi:hypothetical protein PtB15_4B569 [Puccinia triticina]|nr:hypothetical protein PtB15_4B569 [Puccinia triticina]
MARHQLQTRPRRLQSDNRTCNNQASTGPYISPRFSFRDLEPPLPPYEEPKPTASVESPFSSRRAETRTDERVGQSTEEEGAVLRDEETSRQTSEEEVRGSKDVVSGPEIDHAAVRCNTQLSVLQLDRTIESDARKLTEDVGEGGSTSISGRESRFKIEWGDCAPRTTRRTRALKIEERFEAYHQSQMATLKKIGALMDEEVFEEFKYLVEEWTEELKNLEKNLKEY